MKYQIENFIKIDHWNKDANIKNLVEECRFLGDAFIRLTEQLETLDATNGVFKDPKIKARMAVIHNLKKREEAKKRQLEEKRKKERELAKAKKAVMDKLTHEEKVAFGLVREK